MDVASDLAANTDRKTSWLGILRWRGVSAGGYRERVFVEWIARARGREVGVSEGESSESGMKVSRERQGTERIEKLLETRGEGGSEERR